MKMDPLDHLKHIMSEEREALLEQLARGQSKDYAEYKYVCGQLTLVTKCVRWIEDTRKKMDMEE